MFRILAAAALAALIATPVWAKGFAEMFPQRAGMEAGPERDFLESLDYRQGGIELEGGFAELRVPEGFYFLGPEDAEAVLVDAWGNPPADELPLGMILPADSTPTDDGGWVYVSNAELSLSGGVGALSFAADGSLRDAYPILSGTSRNCAGGATPWPGAGIDVAVQAGLVAQIAEIDLQGFQCTAPDGREIRFKE